ncbi:alcohol dehydrogenase catalytic domain-containing protein [Actinoplanes sp. NBRC 103695]|uniref:zinc-dependent alcohol dehydrogenase n=1 Tax=Actinoplanes sp. NBRC 103695 TaxID=3032202 RepID=UPI0024A1C899|nr:alcohol dehydrogenase catalytic domain-containing protein [Actinoplanes sp. NBRC 103695]GLY94529.1 alcohol dehydrogenase [Actinoplanes sp. NBRC 103695]
MKALVLGSDRTLELVERPRPACAAPDDVVLRVVQVGICGTDRGVLLGKFPAEPGVVMGHEAVGEVVETGRGVTTLKPGDRVIINPTLYCGLCDPCRDGVLNFCENKAGNEIGIDRDGAFAEFMRLEERFLHLIPDGMSYDRAVLVEPLACVLNNLQAAAVTADDRVAVLGAGPIGTVTALAASHFGASVRLLEKDPFRRDAAIAFFEGTAVTIEELASGEADVVVDTVGSLLEQACALAAPRGRVVVMGFDERATAEVRPLELLQRGLRIIGAGDYNSQVFGRAVRMARHLPLERIVSHHFGLDRVDAALRALGVGEGAAYAGMKIVIEPGGAA